jgi:hypothetical protein
MPLRRASLLLLLTLCTANSSCTELPTSSDDDASVSKLERRELVIGERRPNAPEVVAVGPPKERIRRGTSSFSRLVSCKDCAFVFKNEERNHSDRMMTPRLQSALQRLSRLVKQTWPKLELRVTEAWDENREHGSDSVHYEGRAADITTSDQDPKKLGRLAALAVSAGFDWVFYEDATHVHVSVRR